MEIYRKVIAIKDGKIQPLKTFLEQDIANLCKEIDNLVIYCIDNYYNEENLTEEDVKNNIKTALDEIINSEDYDQEHSVITSMAYASKIEYPESEYYYDGEGNFDGKSLPIKEILDKYSAILESLDFVNINALVQYEHRVAFIYRHKGGFANDNV